MSIAAYKREKDSKMASLRIPDFARLHAMENERAARWKERNNKPPTVPKGFRLTNFANGQTSNIPPQSYRPTIKDCKDDAITVHETSKPQAPVVQNVPPADLQQSNKPEVINAQIASSPMNTGSKFVNKVKEARVAVSKVNDTEIAQPDPGPEDATIIHQPQRPPAFSEKACTGNEGAGTIAGRISHPYSIPSNPQIHALFSIKPLAFSRSSCFSIPPCQSFRYIT
jgi:hypothetical protein